jgi:hypothetical protein
LIDSAQGSASKGTSQQHYQSTPSKKATPLGEEESQGLRIDCTSQVEPILEAKEEETPLLLPSWARLDLSPTKVLDEDELRQKHDQEGNVESEQQEPSSQESVQHSTRPSIRNNQSIRGEPEMEGQKRQQKNVLIRSKSRGTSKKPVSKNTSQRDVLSGLRDSRDLKVNLNLQRQLRPASRL